MRPGENSGPARQFSWLLQTLREKARSPESHAQKTVYCLYRRRTTPPSALSSAPGCGRWGRISVANIEQQPQQRRLYIALVILLLGVLPAAVQIIWRMGGPAPLPGLRRLGNRLWCWRAERLAGQNYVRHAVFRSMKYGLECLLAT